ncbi:unnamed protein product [Brachionus calyciflorus]|uniref:Phosphodiesterase n=1 Tax=Brachionus calyciflorus TaxID=104777 RepID=A0A813XCZ4_9BILA|nr:unnamed protein product [Brachionus calyciflorus]
MKNASDNCMKSNDFELVIENWLDEHKGWFSSYALDKLDMYTVEKWLSLNGLKICKCNDENPTGRKFLYPKRNSIPSSLLTNCSILNQNKDFSKLYKKSSITSSVRIPLKENNFNTRRISNLSVNNNNNFNDHLRSTSTSCLIRNRKILPGLNKQSSELNLELTIESNTDKKIKKNSNENLRPRFDIDVPSEEILSPSSNTFDFFMNKKNNFFHKNQVTPQDPTSTTSNLLKILIKSKIKLPSCFYKISDTDKLKLRKEKNNDFEFLLDLIKDTLNELNLSGIRERISNNLKILVNCEQVFVYLVGKNRERLRPVNSSFFNDEIKERGKIKTENFVYDNEADFLSCSNLIEYVAQSGNFVNIPDVNQDPGFISSADRNHGCITKSILCMPIKNLNNEVIAVVKLINRFIQNENEICQFYDCDIQLLNEYLKFCGISIAHAQLFDLYASEYERNRSLLEVLHEIFEQQTNIDIILFRIMQKAQELLKCKRCSILVLVDNEDQENLNVRKAFDLFKNGDNPDQRRQSVEDDDGTKISRYLAEYVIKTGEKVNLADAYLDARFDPIVDSAWRQKTKGLLCMPIFNRERCVIGCAQVSNRIDNSPFDENDEQLFEAFGIFCGLAINNTLIYHELEKSMAEKSVALEVLSYHATCPKNEVNLFIDKNSKELDYYSKESLRSYSFNDFSLNVDQMVLAAFEMFKQSGLMKTFQIDKRTLMQWLLTVRKNYRDLEYHNWSHAFNVCQTMFAIFENSVISNYLNDLEKLALIVGCLCHDLDHRGTNNMFQAESHSALAQLYGTNGTMEKHHFNHCVMILNTPGHDIFSHVKPQTYELLISYIKEAILATDLVEHFSIRKDFERATKSNGTNWYEEPYSNLLRKILMTCCDLAAVSKPWDIHKRVVDLVTKEFFAQGERERLELKIEPNEMMDARRSHELPRLQVGWIDNVCLPLYTNVSYICKSFEEHLERIENNRKNWYQLQDRPNKETKKILPNC